MIKFLVPAMSVLLTFTSEAHDIPQSVDGVITIRVTCKTTPKGLTSPRWTMHQPYFEGIKCWHSANAPATYALASSVSVPEPPVPQPMALAPKALDVDKMFKEFQQWFYQHQNVCLLDAKECGFK